MRWEKELDRERVDEAHKKEAAERFIRRCERWDPENEPFYYERSRWRRQRQVHLAREEAADAQDEEDEKASEAAAKREAEKFLQQQEEEMKKLAEQQRAAGVLLPGAVESGPLKLTIAPKTKESTEEDSLHPHATAPLAAAPKTALLGAADEDDDAQIRRKKLAPIDFRDTKTEAELMEERLAELKKIRDKLPSDWEGISAMSPNWEFIDSVRVTLYLLDNQQNTNALPDSQSLTKEYQKIVDDQVVESLGESAPELVDAIMEKLAAKASAAELVSEVEPVSRLHEYWSRKSLKIVAPFPNRFSMRKLKFSSRDYGEQ